MIGRSSLSRFLVRRLLPAAIVVPIVLGWLRLEGQRAGLYGTDFGVVMMTAANVLISSALVLGCLFTDRLRRALARTIRDKRPVAVLFMDLDDFKVVNDSLGHETGDKLLVIVARRLQACLRPRDTIGRLGGDEFAVLLEDLPDTEYPTMVARRIIEALRAPFTIEGREVFISASIGIATSGVAGGDRPEVLMRDADAAMYAAKGMGRSRHAVFDQSMNHRALRRLDLENDLRRAVEREEFILHYQPKVSIGTGEVVGMEALVRWEHPERGLTYPGEFIWFAEETGLIVPIGRWALREASRQVKEWQDRRAPRTSLTMSVNLSAKQFEHAELIRDAAEILEETGLDACRLELEITESVLMDDAPLNAEIMRELKALGVKLPIDDFGTGYSSLSYLKRFPVEYLKIDRSFVGKLGEEPDDTALVSGVIGLAHTLGFKVVAEGVETAEQLAKLREARCDLAQGYYLSMPLPGEAAKTLLDKRLPFVGGPP